MIDVLHDNGASVGDLRAEIERLRAAVTVQGAEIDRVCKTALSAKDEIERLRMALEKAKTELQWNMLDLAIATIDAALQPKEGEK